jgi:hypothetical protein
MSAFCVAVWPKSWSAIVSIRGSVHHHDVLEALAPVSVEDARMVGRDRGLAPLGGHHTSRKRSGGARSCESRQRVVKADAASRRPNYRNRTQFDDHRKKDRCVVAVDAQSFAVESRSPVYFSARGLRKSPARIFGCERSYCGG